MARSRAAVVALACLALLAQRVGAVTTIKNIEVRGRAAESAGRARAWWGTRRQRARGRVGLGLAPPFWASPAPCLGSVLAPPVARGGAMSERSRWRRLAPRLPRRLHCVPALPAGWLRAWAVWDGEICH